MKYLNFSKIAPNIKGLGKSILLIALSLGILYIGVIIYSIVFEKEELAIDRYNFKQLESIKLIVGKKSLDSTRINFDDLNGFNRVYGANIKPIKKCYYMSNDNMLYPYIFSFKLESTVFKLLYLGKYYAYPGYGIIYFRTPCFGLHELGEDTQNYWCKNYSAYPQIVEKISQPCED